MIAVAKLFEIGAKSLEFAAVELDAHQHPPIGGAVVAVVEQADVPAAAQPREKVEQGAGAFGKDEAEQPLVLHLGRVAAHHVTDVELGGLVVAQINHRKSFVFELFLQAGLLLGAAGEFHPAEDLGVGRIVIAIVELGDVALAQLAAEAQKAPRPFGNLHGEDRLALLPQLGALGYMAQAVEVDVGAAEHRHQALAGQIAALGVLFDSRHRQSPSRLGDAAGVVVDVLDGGADLVGAHQHHLVHELAGKAEGLLADLAYRHPVGEQAHLLERHPAAGRQGPFQGGGVLGFHADHPNLGTHPLDVSRHAGDQATAAHRHIDGVERILVLA